MVRLESVVVPVAVVTGAGQRVGLAVARALLHDGFDAVLCAHRSRASAEELATEFRARGRSVTVEATDLADGAAVDALAARIRDRHPEVQLLVHNAGIFEEAPFGSVTRAQYARMQAINVEAPFFLTQGLLAALRAAGDALVVHVTDITADRPISRHAHYSMSKAALAMLTRALTVELGPTVRVCSVAPGYVAFPEGWNEERRERLLQRVPLRRVGAPDDVAQAILFLWRAKYLNGLELPVDGGRQVVL